MIISGSEHANKNGGEQKIKVKFAVFKIVAEGKDMFIDIAGIDGSGKSTVAKELKRLLELERYKCKMFHGYIPRTNMYMLLEKLVIA